MLRSCFSIGTHTGSLWEVLTPGTMDRCRAVAADLSPGPETDTPDGFVHPSHHALRPSTLRISSSEACLNSHPGSAAALERLGTRWSLLDNGVDPLCHTPQLSPHMNIFSSLSWIQPAAVAGSQHEVAAAEECPAAPSLSASWGSDLCSLLCPPEPGVGDAPTPAALFPAAALPTSPASNRAAVLRPGLLVAAPSALAAAAALSAVVTAAAVAPSAVAAVAAAESPFTGAASDLRSTRLNVSGSSNATPAVSGHAQRCSPHGCAPHSPLDHSPLHQE